MDPNKLNEPEILLRTQYESLRREIADQMSQISALETWVVAAVGGVWAWLFIHVEAPRAAWLVPVVLVPF